MPIITTDTSLAVAGGRSIRIPGLPDFNAGDVAYKITEFAGWFDGFAPSPVMVANGGGAGAVASGDWEPSEHYYTLTGRIDTGDRAALATLRGLLLAGLPAGQEAALECRGNGLDTDLKVFVRRYDKAQFTPSSRLDFSIPLVAPDPYKYALTPLTGSTGVHTGEQWNRTYALSGSTWVRTYALVDGKWVRTYTQATPSGPYPASLTLTSPGSVSSRRVTVTVAGPLTAGDWHLLNETTGKRMWVEVGVLAGQTLVLDSHKRTARLAGDDVTHRMFGDWLALDPGQNRYRLVSGTRSAAYASVEALPAYE